MLVDVSSGFTLALYGADYLMQSNDWNAIEIDEETIRLRERS